MFRAEIQWLEIGPTLKLEGKLGGHWAEQARVLVTTEVLPKGLIVDLSDLSHVDSAGEQLLKWLASLGAFFVADTAYAMAVCERLGLLPMQPISERHKGRQGHNEERRSTKQPHPVDVC